MMADTFSIIDFYIQYCNEVTITSYAPEECKPSTWEIQKHCLPPNAFKPTHINLLRETKKPLMELLHLHSFYFKTTAPSNNR